MTEPLNRETTNPARPIGSVDRVVDDAIDPDGPSEGGRGQLAELPAHEIDEDETVGGGVLSQGGTAVDRGTGTLGGQAQGTPPDDEPGDDQNNDPDEVVPNPATHA